MEVGRSSILTRRFPALASRDYVLFVAGQLISVIGTWMQATALPYLAYRMTGRPLDLGLIGFASTLPTLLFALPAARPSKSAAVAQMVRAMSAGFIGFDQRPRLPCRISQSACGPGAPRASLGPIALYVVALGGAGDGIRTRDQRLGRPWVDSRNPQ